MQEGDVILTPVPQADGQIKNRPAVILKAMPPFQDLLVCGVSTQLRQQVEGFDEMISTADADFSPSGLLAPSLIQLGFLAVLPQKNVAGAIGAIAADRHQRLLRNLSNYLLQDLPKPAKE